jgi:GNAT superfamily N-acetyltransferase
MTVPVVTLVPEPDHSLSQVILDNLRAFNRSRFPDSGTDSNLAVVIREEEAGEPVGGLWARTSGGWLAIELIFVPEHHRGKGLARQLIRLAEEEAVKRGCRAAWLDTLNRDAAALYERLGYVRFGELNDYPPGNSRFFLQKKL